MAKQALDRTERNNQILASLPTLTRKRVNDRPVTWHVPHSALTLMTKEPKTAREIAQLIKGRAYALLGPWPIDLELFVFSTASDWKCGLT